MTGVVIWLSGCSSVGKTTIIDHLIPFLSRSFLRVGIDHFLPMLPPSLVRLPRGAAVPLWWRGFQPPSGQCDGIEWTPRGDDPTALQVRVGCAGEKFLRGYYSSLAALAGTGNNLIVDDVFFFDPGPFRNEILALHRALFPRERLLMIRVFAPLEVVEKRESARGDRVVGQARGHHAFCHVGVDQYDLDFDVSQEGCSEGIAREIAATVNRRWPVAIDHLKASISTLRTVYNIRSLGKKLTTSGSLTKEGVLFRCAFPKGVGPDDMSHDLQVLKETFKIKTVRTTCSQINFPPHDHSWKHRSST